MIGAGPLVCELFQVCRKHAPIVALRRSASWYTPRDDADRADTRTAAEINPIHSSLRERCTISRVVSSTTTPVLGGAKCPVLVVPANRSKQSAVADEITSYIGEAEYSGMLYVPKLPSALARVAKMR